MPLNMPGDAEKPEDERPENSFGPERPVILGDLEGEYLPQEGVVVSARPEALTIRTVAFFDTGEPLFIEFPPTHPDMPHRTAVIRGRVLGARDENGAVLLEVGLNLMPDVEETDIGSLPLTHEEAAALIEETRAVLAQAGRQGALPVADVGSLLEEYRKRPKATLARRAARYAVAAAVMISILVAVLYMVSVVAPPGRVPWEVTGIPGSEAPLPLQETDADSNHSHPGLPGLGAGDGAEDLLPTSPPPFVWQPGTWVEMEEPARGTLPLEGTPPPSIGPLFSPVGFVMAAMRPLVGPAAESRGLSQTPVFVVSEMLEPAHEPASESLAPGGGASPQAAGAEGGLPGGEPGAVGPGSGLAGETESGADAAGPDSPAPAPVGESPAENQPGSAESELAALSSPPFPLGMGGPADPDAPLSFERPDSPNYAYGDEKEEPLANGGDETSEPEPAGDTPADGEGGMPLEQEAESAPEAPFPINNAPDRVEIEVDKSDYTLTVHFDGAPVARFPVGLGHDNATPEGQFTIANKITDPDWFDRGRVVKSGDPENPLGSRWMGLGTGGRATSYGIHPTKEPESIGADMSRGCIRMRPGDAETVFRLCPVGTVVSIVQ